MSIIIIKNGKNLNLKKYVKSVLLEFKVKKN